MKKQSSLLCMGILLFYVQVYAEVPHFSGTYTYYDTVEVLQIQSRKVIFGGNQQGKDRVEQLSTEGYECSVRWRQMWLCRKFLDEQEAETPEALQSRAERKLGGALSLTFGLRRGPPVLLHQGSDGEFKRWQVPQEVTISGVSFPMLYFQLSRLGNGSWMGKIIPMKGDGQNSGIEYIYTPQDKKLGIVQQVHSDSHELMVLYKFNLDPE